MDTSTLFDHNSDLYAAARPLYPKALFDYAASLVNKHAEAWDCATGNGQAAVGLSAFFDKVSATDISESQIANAFVRDNISYSVQPAEATGFADNQFDLVSVAQALHWFDLDLFWNEVARVLKPGGAFIAFSYMWPHVDDAIDQLVEQQIKAIVAPYWASNNQLVWNAYTTLALPFKRLAAPEIVMQVSWNLEQFLNHIRSWSGTRLALEQLGSAFFDDAAAQLSRAWGDPCEQKQVSYPLVIVAGSAWV